MEGDFKGASARLTAFVSRFNAAGACHSNAAAPEIGLEARNHSPAHLKTSHDFSGVQPQSQLEF